MLGAGEIGLRGRNLLDDFLDDTACFDAGEAGFGFDDEAVGDDVGSEILDGFGDHEVAGFENRQGLCHAHEGEGGTRAGRELQVFATPGGGNDFDDVAADLVGDSDLPHGGEEVDDLVSLDGWLDAVDGVLFDLVVEDGAFVFDADVAESGADHEAVHLGFGKWIGAAEFDRVLSGDDEEQAIEIVACAIDGGLALGHGFEQGGLGARGGAVDFIREQDVGEDRSGTKAELLVGRVEHGDAENVGGQQVGGELDAFEGGAGNGARDGFGEGGLAGAGDILDQGVAAGGEAGEDTADGVILADDDLSYGLFELVGGLLRGGGHGVIG